MNGHTRTSSENGIRANQALWELRRLRRELPSLLEEDSSVREEVIRELRLLNRDCESPWHTIQRVLNFGPWDNITTGIAVNMGIYRILSESSEPLSAAEIAKKCNAELHFTQRILRTLDALGSVQQRFIGTEVLYGPTTVSKTFVTPFGEAAARWMTECMTPGYYRLPSKLKKEGYKSTVCGTDTVFNDMYNVPGKTLWEILGTSEFVGDMGTFMAEFLMQRAPWWKFYPIEERLVVGASKSPDDILMVDIGGFTGSQAAAMRAQFPEASAKVVIMDLPHALPSEPPAGTVTFAHSFFEPFPAGLQGARFYYMRWIGHDWSQKEYIQILSNIRAAMKHGYSKLLINDWVVPEKNPHPFMCTQDLGMMTLGGGEERSEARHREAIEAAGLKLKQIFHAGDGVSEEILECEVPGEE